MHSIIWPKRLIPLRFSYKDPLVFLNNGIVVVFGHSITYTTRRNALSFCDTTSPPPLNSDGCMLLGPKAMNRSSNLNFSGVGASDDNSRFRSVVISCVDGQLNCSFVCSILRGVDHFTNTGLFQFNVK